jgi:photosystem II stability/assembly factor-like uncharacterized protein
MKSYPDAVGAFTTIALASLASVFSGTVQATELAVAELQGKTHIHGLAVDRSDPSQLLIATHHGLFRAGLDGQAELVSPVQDFMGFNPHPADPDRLFASGHPATGGNLGFIASDDGGRTWQQISPGLNGPVDFHQLTVSPADPNRVYGAYGGLQVSRDGGRTWTPAGPSPAGLIDLAASASDADTLYAATETGLLVSRDAGIGWAPVLEGAPVSLVEVTSGGDLYAFVLGRGLLASKEDTIDLAATSDDFGDSYLLHLAVDPTNPDRMFAASGEGRILASVDRGRSWKSFGSDP